MKKIAIILVVPLMVAGCANPHTVKTHHMKNGDVCYTVEARNGNPRGIDCVEHR